MYGSEEALLAIQKLFPSLITTKGSYCPITTGDRKRGKILRRTSNSRLLNHKAKILWQLENFETVSVTFVVKERTGGSDPVTFLK